VLEKRTATRLVALPDRTDDRQIREGAISRNIAGPYVAASRGNSRSRARVQRQSASITWGLPELPGKSPQPDRWFCSEERPRGRRFRSLNWRGPKDK